MCHIYCTKNSVNIQNTTWLGKRMHEQCTYDNTKCLWFNKTLYHFQYFPPYSCQYHSKAFALKHFHSKSFYWCLTFKCFLSISNTLHFRNCYTFHAFIFKFLSFEYLFYLKKFYNFLALNAFFTFRIFYVNYFSYVSTSFTCLLCSFTCLYNWPLFMQFSFAHICLIIPLDL